MIRQRVAFGRTLARLKALRPVSRVSRSPSRASTTTSFLSAVMSTLMVPRARPEAGPRVVEADDLLPRQALVGRALGAVLGEAVAVAVAVARDGVGRGSRDLLGGRAAAATTTTPGRRTRRVDSQAEPEQARRGSCAHEVMSRRQACPRCRRARLAEAATAAWEPVTWAPATGHCTLRVEHGLTLDSARAASASSGAPGGEQQVLPLHRAVGDVAIPVGREGLVELGRAVPGRRRGTGRRRSSARRCA